MILIIPYNLIIIPYNRGADRGEALRLSESDWFAQLVCVRVIVRPCNTIQFLHLYNNI